MSADLPAILFTAFEPSGDAHAAPIIRELRHRAPSMPIYAWGGPQMEAAGATLVEATATDGAMGLGAITAARRVKREIKRIHQWARGNPVKMLVAVDSPAANFPICKRVRPLGVRVVHLVAPQLWAWGGWRIKKLRKLTDLVICLLPFEEQWFRERNVPAKFVGHPAINRELDQAKINEVAAGLPRGSPRVAIFPGSRTQEVKANMPLLAKVYTELQDRHSGMAGLIVAANDNLAGLIRRKIKVFPTGLHMVTGMLDASIGWCDMAIAVSGTVTMHITRQQKPMVGVYKTGLVGAIGAKIMLRTPYRLLPNLIAETEIVPEFVPHAGGAMPIIEASSYLLRDSQHLAVQREALGRVCQRFSNKRPAVEAVNHMVRLLTGRAVTEIGCGRVGVRARARVRDRDRPTGATPGTPQPHTHRSHADR